MKAGILEGNTYRKFKDFILPEVYSGIESSVPYLVIGLIEEKEPIGALVGYVEDSGMFNIASVYVRPDYRRNGGGMMLVSELREIMKKNNIPAAVISYIEMEGEGESLDEFFDAIAAFERWDLEMLYRVQPWEDTDVPEDETDEDTNIAVSRLTGVPDNKLKTITDHAEGGNFKPTGFDPGKAGLDKELSFVAFTENKIEGYLFAYNDEKMKNVILEISFGSGEETIILLYREFLNAFSRKYPEGTKYVYIPAPNSEIEDIIDSEDLERLQHNYILY